MKPSDWKNLFPGLIKYQQPKQHSIKQNGLPPLYPKNVRSISIKGGIAFGPRLTKLNTSADTSPQL